MPIEIKTLRSGDEHLLTKVSEDVFDDALHAARTQEFLADPRHHLIVALDDNLIVGFISAMHYVHPDKPHPELWINEVGTAPSHQGRGIGKAMMQAALAVGRALGCKEAWVLTNRSNTPAQNLYRASGGVADEEDIVMFTFYVDETNATEA